MQHKPKSFSVDNLMKVWEDESTKKFEIAAKHYYDLFAYHAAQRLTTFNYFFVSLSFLSGAYATLIMKGADGRPRFAIAAALAVAAYLLVLAFARLDRRNEQIIGANERPLLRIQKVFADSLSQNGEDHLWQTFLVTDDAYWFRTFGDLLPLIYLIAATLTAGGAGYACKEAGAFPLAQADCVSGLVATALVVLAIVVIYGKGVRKHGRPDP